MKRRQLARLRKRVAEPPYPGVGTQQPIEPSKDEASKDEASKDEASKDLGEDTNMEKNTYESLSRSHAIIEFSPDGTIISANDKFCGVVGYDRDELVGQHHRILVAPAIAASVEYEEMWRSLAKGQAFSGELERVTKTGKHIWLRACYSPVVDDAKVSRIISLADDITETKQASIEAAGKLGAIDKSQAVIEFDLEGNILTFNDNFQSAFGYSRQELVGQHHRTLVRPEEARRPEYEEFWRKLGRGEFDSGDYCRVDRDGKDVWIQATYNPILDPSGTPFKVVKYATDITEAKLRATESTGKLEAISKSQAVIEFDLDGNILDFNDNFESALGYSRRELIGLHHRTLVSKEEALSPEYAELWRTLGRGEFAAGEFRRIAKDGSDVWIQASYNPICDPSGKPFKVVKYATDITSTTTAVRAVQQALHSLASGNFDATINMTFDGELEAMKENVNGIGRVLRGFLGEVGSLLSAAQGGDLSVRADPESFDGSYEEMILGVNQMVDALLSPLDAIRSALGKVASGDLTAYVTESYEGEHGALKDALNKTLDGMNGLLTQVSGSSDTISRSASEVAGSAEALSQGASEQAATVEEISGQMTQITEQTRQNAENATQANLLAEAARDGAQDGDRQMSQMVEAMGSIEEGSQNISKIIKVIDEIAFQTNLLALNAAVEAARAGVHGRGFAVVAEEVRNLAARSASAAKETTELIEGSIKQVSAGTLIANETAGALGAIVRDVGKVTDLVAEIAAASKEQADAITQTNIGLDQINTVTQRNTATSEESAAASQNMLSQVEKMQEMLQQFTLRAPPQQAGEVNAEQLTPELMEALQAFMAERGQARNFEQGQESHPSPPQSAQRSNTANHDSRSIGAGDAPRIVLDAQEFGKY